MRILVADDEPIEREALRVLVQRYLNGVEIVGEAITGRQVIEMAEAVRPDVILLDIEMPGLSGLEALKEIRQRTPGVRCLVVSAYDYFHFAREALRLGAVDYLLKPVKRDQMIEVLTRLKQEMAQERQRRQDELVQKEVLRGLHPLAEHELVAMVERGARREQAQALLQLLDLRLEAGLCMVVGLHERPFERDVPAEEQPRRIQDAHQYLASLSHVLGTCAVGAWKAEDLATILVELEQPVDDYHIRSWTTEMARRLRDRVKEQTGVRLRIGIGNPREGWENLTQSFREALSALRFEGISEKVHHFGDLAQQDEVDPPGDAPEVTRKWRPTAAVLRAVELGKQFVRENFAAEITLERVAQVVSLTPYYYSKVFSQVGGETLVDYITRVRVEEAKRLLTDPEVSIKEACFRVGYNDPNYFSRVFKKVTGRTPTDYRSGGQS